MSSNLGENPGLSRTEIVLATPAHLPQILDIYNHYVAQTVVTFHLDPQPLSFIKGNYEKVLAHKLPFLVITSVNPVVPSSSPISSSSSTETPSPSRVLGYTYAVPYNAERIAYAAAVEITLLLDPSVTGHGLGKSLLSALIESLRTNDTGREIRVRELVAAMAAFEGDATRFYQREGFREAGRLRALGWKFGKWVDVVLWQMSLGGAKERGEVEESGEGKDGRRKTEDGR